MWLHTSQRPPFLYLSHWYEPHGSGGGVVGSVEDETGGWSPPPIEGRTFAARVVGGGLGSAPAAKGLMPVAKAGGGGGGGRGRGRLGESGGAGGAAGAGVPLPRRGLVGLTSSSKFGRRRQPAMMFFRGNSFAKSVSF